MIRNFFILFLFLLAGWNSNLSAKDQLDLSYISLDEPGLTTSQDFAIIREIPYRSEKQDSVTSTNTIEEEEESLDEESDFDSVDHLGYFKEFVSVFCAQSRVHFINDDHSVTRWVNLTPLASNKWYLEIEVFRI